MAPYFKPVDYKNNSNKRNDDFDWGLLAAAAPGVALFVIALLINACPY